MGGFKNKLKAAYDRLPRLACQGKCQDACGPIACTAGEASLMREAAGGRPLVFDPQTLRCGYLKDGKCEVYVVRPFVCRAWGAVARMPCRFGCQPIDSVLSREAEDRAFRMVQEAGGHTVVSRSLGATRPTGGGVD